MPAPIIRSAEFVKSAPNISMAPDTGEMPEIVFVGRSNVGKSSLINSLLLRKNLAKTSNTPGKTRLINFYRINDALMLVDLPGYGFAKVSHAEQAAWQKSLTKYITSRKEICLVLSLMDARHPPQDSDLNMLQWLFQHQLPVEVVLTKSDKLGKKDLAKQVTVFSNDLEWAREKLIVYAATTHVGRDKLWERMMEYAPVMEAAPSVP